MVALSFKLDLKPLWIVQYFAFAYLDMVGVELVARQWIEGAEVLAPGENSISVHGRTVPAKEILH